MLHHVEGSPLPAARLTAAIFMVIAAMSLVRVVFDVTASPEDDIFNAYLHDTLIVLAYQMLHVSLTFSLYLMANGRLVGRLERDVEERTRLAAANRQFQAIVHSSDDAIIAKTLDGIVMAWNPGAEAMFGFNSREMIGTPMIALYPDDRLDEERAILDRIRAGERVEHFETQRRHKNGSVIDVSVTISPIRDENSRIVGASKIARNITERKRTELELSRLATTDTLSGLANRGQFMSRATQELARTARYGAPLSVLMIDIDHFKVVNDTYGHHTGDRVIESLGRLLREALRDIDLAGRVGGEEFAVLLPQTILIHAVEAAERLRAKVADMEVPLEQGVPLRITISIGVASHTGDGVNLDTLLNRADTALYDAKHAGRDRVCVYGGIPAA
jgi:diguanylate cyclase (GGDEF)-like protein/PAS domain S-box-containing protein